MRSAGRQIMWRIWRTEGSVAGKKAWRWKLMFGYDRKQQEKIEIPLLVDCVKYEIALEKYNRALASIERALDIISVGRSMQYVGELHFLKAQVLSCVQNSIDKNREWQDECKRECFMAYVVFGVMGKKEEKEEIYKYCLEKLNWQITEQMMLSD